MSSPRRLKWIIGLALVGVGLSVYSLLHKYGVASGAICAINETFDCDLVNQGPYSKMFGIPVAGIGIGGYLFLAAAALMKLKNPLDKSLSLFLLLASLGGLSFALYLTSIEAFVLNTWCLICVTSQLVILAITALTIIHYRSDRV